MTAPLARINAFRKAVVATYKLAFGDTLRSVEEQFGRFNLEELEKASLPETALRFAVLESPMEQQADATLHAKLRVAAFIICGTRDADDRAWALAELAALKLPNQRWGLTNLQAPERVNVQPVITGGIKNRQVAVMAVEWRQTLIGLGPSIFDAAGVLIDGVLINGDELPTPEVSSDE